MYALIVNWLTDLASFKLWFNNNEMDSQFGTTMKLDKTFINGGVELLTKLYALENGKEWPVDYNSLQSDIKEKFTEFKTNSELYCVRLEAAGNRFRMLAKIGHFYVWFQSFLFPITMAVSALIALYCKGLFILPS